MPWQNLGIVPKSAAKKIWEMGKDAIFDVARIDEIEAETKHDVIAFLTHLSEIVGPEARFVHQGMTSSDVLDTCFNIQLVRAADLLIADIDGLLAALKRRALEHKDSRLHRTQPWHSCGAHDIWREAGLFLRGVYPLPGAVDCGQAGGFHLRDFRRCGHFCQH